jgi:DNA end-binding protein Ku
MLEKPFYLEPIAKGEKVYTLLREAMLAAGVVGIARLVMHTKEHLAVLVPSGPALMLDTLRWAHELRPWTELKLPPEGRKAASLKDAELKMAVQLIEDMTEAGSPSATRTASRRPSRPWWTAAPRRARPRRWSRWKTAPSRRPATWST